LSEGRESLYLVHIAGHFQLGFRALLMFSATKMFQ